MMLFPLVFLPELINEICGLAFQDLNEFSLLLLLMDKMKSMVDQAGPEVRGQAVITLLN